MKDKLKKIYDHIFNILLVFVFFTSATWSIAISVVMPKIGLNILFISIGWYGFYSYLKHREE